MMSVPPSRFKIAVLDDYQHVALTTADWSVLQSSSTITIFNDHLSDTEELKLRLYPYDVIAVMRERTPLTRELLSGLPNLKLIVSTAMRNASIDLQAAAEAGIEVRHTGYVWSGAPELTWALLMSIARRIPQEVQNFRSGKWQTTIGVDLKGKTIGIIGLGNIGSAVAAYARVFEMNILCWSPNLTPEKAEAAGLRLTDKETLFRESDFISVHMVLSERSKGIVGAPELALMKPTSYIINTSRGPLIEEEALIETLKHRKIAGAALDVFDVEPLPADHPFRNMDNVLATGHIGYVTEDTYAVFYTGTVKAIEEWVSLKKES